MDYTVDSALMQLLFEGPPSPKSLHNEWSLHIFPSCAGLTCCDASDCTPHVLSIQRIMELPLTGYHDTNSRTLANIVKVQRVFVYQWVATVIQCMATKHPGLVDVYGISGGEKGDCVWRCTTHPWDERVGPPSVCVCMCVCVCVCVCMHVCVRAYVMRVCVCVFTSLHMCTFTIHTLLNTSVM